MASLSRIVLFIGVAFSLGSCTSEEVVRQPTPSPTTTTTVRTTTTTTSNQPVAVGIPVQYRPGFIRSPLAPNAGVIDVRGVPSGTEIQDPYSGQTIRVP
jgi:hypothetical protein